MCCCEVSEGRELPAERGVLVLLVGSSGELVRFADGKLKGKG